MIELLEAKVGFKPRNEAVTHMECRMVFLTLFIIEPDSRSGSGLRRRNKVEQTLEMIFYT